MLGRIADTKTLATGALFMGAAVLAPAGGALAENLPGEGKTVDPARATWSTGYFQAAVYNAMLEELGYEISDTTELKNELFYQAVSQGDVDYWVNGWFPLHNDLMAKAEGASQVGYVAKGGALQGYLIDKKTADAHNVTNIEDFKKPEIRSLFDSDGDGKAEMVACPPGWGCEKVITHHIQAYDLEDHIDPIQAEYSASMADAMGRYKSGEPIFFYTWTPNWTVGELEPGKDVVWIEVPRPDLPESQKQYEDATTVSGVAGCVDDPCEMGWPANDIRPVANKEFLENNPSVSKLLEVAEIPLEDIFAQNARMQKGEDSQADIERHADEWIANNRDLVDGWLDEARKASM